MFPEFGFLKIGDLLVTALIIFLKQKMFLTPCICQSCLHFWDSSAFAFSVLVILSWGSSVLIIFCFLQTLYFFIEPISTLPANHVFLYWASIQALFRKIAAALPGMETLSSTKQEDMVDVNLKSSSASAQSQPQSSGCACWMWFVL